MYSLVLTRFGVIVATESIHELEKGWTFGGGTLLNPDLSPGNRGEPTASSVDRRLRKHPLVRAIGISTDLTC